MQILFHIGAHSTDNGLLIRSILRNRGTLARQHIGVPGPGRYRELIGDVSTTLRGAPASEETETMLLDLIRDDDTAERILLSNENFLCRDSVVLSPDGLYPKAGKSAWLRNCFPSHEVEFAIGIRNPATLVPDLIGRLPEDDRGAALAALDLDRLRWSDVIAAIANENPGSPITVWCHEDTPYIWGALMSELTAHDPDTCLDGADDMLAQLISEEGLTLFAAYAEAHGPLSDDQRGRAVTRFLTEHGLPGEIEEEIDLPGWTDDTVARLSDAYEADARAIAGLQCVTMVQP